MNTERQIYQPKICEETRENIKNRIARDRAMQRQELEKNYLDLSFAIDQVNEKDMKASRTSKVNDPKEVWSSK